MKFPQDFIDRVREANNLVDIIGQYVQLRKTGGNYQGLCPFHNEKSPSFSVSEDKQVYHCFGCKESGNVISFVQKYQGLTFPETVEYLAARAGLEIPKVEGEEKFNRARDSRENLYRVNAFACEFFHQELKRLPAGHEVKQYLKSRGLTEELVNAYKLGYAPDAWSMLSEQFALKRIPVTLGEELGLLKARTGGKSGHYDLFRHRIMFPIFSPARQCLGFGGRIINPEHNPKYLNSPESPVFHKGRVLYGLETSAKFIRNEDEVIIVEGYMDWLALAKVNILNTAATLGTALTTDHAKMIKRYTTKVLLLFDGDEAGRHAAERSLPILLSEGILARGLFLPDQLDPDEFLAEKGVDSLKSSLNSAPDLFELISLEWWSHSKSSPTGKVQLLDKLSPLLSKVSDARLRRLYIQNLSNMMDLDPHLIERGVKIEPSTTPTSVLKQASAAKSAPVTDKIDLSRIPRVELELLNVILMKEVYLKTALESEIMSQLSHEGARQVGQRIEEQYRQMPSKFDNLSALLAGEVQPSEAVTRHLSTPYSRLTEEAALKLLQDCIRRVKENHLRLKSKELVLNLRTANPSESAEQLEQIMNIHRNRRSLTRES